MTQESKIEYLIRSIEGAVTVPWYMEESYRDIRKELIDYVQNLENQLEQLSVSDKVPDDLITMSDAARLIRGDATDGMLAYVNSLVLRGKLKRYEDETEPNPQRKGRVSRSAVMEFKNYRDEVVTNDAP